MKNKQVEEVLTDAWYSVALLFRKGNSDSLITIMIVEKN